MSDNTECTVSVDGVDQQVNKVEIVVYQVGVDGKRLVEVPEGTNWADLFAVIGGEGKRVTVDNEDVRSKEGTVQAGASAVVGLEHGKAGRS